MTSSRWNLKIIVLFIIIILSTLFGIWAIYDSLIITHEYKPNTQIFKDLGTFAEGFPDFKQAATELNIFKITVKDTIPHINSADLSPKCKEDLRVMIDSCHIITEKIVEGMDNITIHSSLIVYSFKHINKRLGQNSTDGYSQLVRQLLDDLRLFLRNVQPTATRMVVLNDILASRDVPCISRKTNERGWGVKSFRVVFYGRMDETQFEYEINLFKRIVNLQADLKRITLNLQHKIEAYIEGAEELYGLARSGLIDGSSFDTKFKQENEERLERVFKLLV